MDYGGVDGDGWGKKKVDDLGGGQVVEEEVGSVVR